MSALFIPTAKNVQSVSSETVPQQLMYKLEWTGASGWAKIGTQLRVIFHSISILFWFCFFFFPLSFSSVPPPFTSILPLLHLSLSLWRWIAIWFTFVARDAMQSHFQVRKVDNALHNLCWCFLAERINTHSMVTYDDIWVFRLDTNSTFTNKQIYTDSVKIWYYTSHIKVSAGTHNICFLDSWHLIRWPDDLFVNICTCFL